MPRLASLIVRLSLSTAALAAFGATAATPAAQAQTATVAYNWAQQSPANSPAGRSYSVTAFDAANGTVLLFGGADANFNPLADTWTWNGTTWIQQSPANSPPPRFYASMAYDAANGTVVLYGGLDSTFTPLGDTWTWNGTNWTQQSPATSPPALYASVMAYSPSGTMVMFGGINGGFALEAGTYTWNGTTWTHQSPANSPPARYDSTMAYDAATSTAVLFGGNNGGQIFADTWIWNGTNWALPAPANSPSARSQSSTAYDAATGTVVLYSGGDNTDPPFNDTWTWNGATWTQQSPPNSPSVRLVPTMAYDAANGTVVLFGGSDGAPLNDTWTYAAGPFLAPATAVATAATQTPVYFNITATGTLGATQVLTQGAANLDFTLGTGSTCTGAATGLCTVNVAFTPTSPGLRLGAVNLTTSSGAIIATAYISGAGTGPQVTFTPGAISTFAGNGGSGYAGDGGPANATSITYPLGLAADSAGNLYIADSGDNRIRKVTAATGNISTVAGSSSTCAGGTEPCGDGNVAVAASLNVPYGVAIDGAGNLYIADSNDNRIRKVTLGTNFISTVAGTGNAGYTASQDTGATAATAATLSSPRGVAVDGAGNLYIADRTNNRIRKVTAATGFISTVAGGGAAPGTCTGSSNSVGDGCIATAASLAFPAGITVDSAGNLFIGDQGDNRIREVTAGTSAINTVAGTGTAGYTASQDTGTTAATAATLSSAFSVSVDGAGNLYIADSANQRVRKVTAATGFISTIAGDGGSGSYTASQDTGTTAATAAALNHPFDAVLDGAGNFYIADNANFRVRKVTATSAPLVFPDTAVNGTSASQTLIVNNIGNTALTLPIPGSGSNPSLSNYFTLSNSSTCPLVYSTSSAGTLAAGASCNELISFTPTVSGSVTGNLTFTDNSLNAAAATQTLRFTGSSTSTLTVTAVSQNATVGTASITLEFIVGYGGNTAPIFTPGVTVNGSATGVGGISCTTKTGHNNCTATYNTSTLTAGTYTITATQPADANYPTSSSGTATLIVTGGTGQLKHPPTLLAPAEILFKR